MEQILECVPNFSEGRQAAVVEAIAESIRSVERVKLLHIDTGKAANRTVMTFAGPPEAVCEAAFRAVRTAAEKIDMRRHTGEHPRIGATDVLPLVPVEGITMEEAVEYAHRLSKRIYEELGIAVYCYEEAALRPERRNLAHCRSGEYEGIREKIAKPEWRPDFGEARYTQQTERSGITVVGARPFLIAVNFNLNTACTETAAAIACDIREKGRTVTDERGNKIRQPGILKGVKAIGWYIKEYGIAQVSVNITDITEGPLHKVFETVSRKAAERGVHVTGTEIIGLVPKRVLTDAGIYFLGKRDPEPVPEEKELIETAVRSMRLDDLCAFDPEKKILEYVLGK